MKNLIGTMQGRLLPKYKGRYQAHPIDYWQKEFEIAKNIGLGCIEFIFDFNEFKKNPLLTEEGLNEINFFFSTPAVLSASSKRIASMTIFLIVLSSMPNHAIHFLVFKDIFLPGVYEVLNPQLKQ